MLTKLTRQLCCCLVLFLASSLAAAAPNDALAPEAAASAHDAAAQAFQQGNELWEQGKRAAALGEFERAYELSPKYQVLYYIGAVNVQLEQWARARRAFELYLELGANELTSEQVAEVRVHLNELNKRTATLTLTLNVPGAEVQVDGTKLESTTISGLILDTGEHVVRISKPGFQSLEQVVRATDGENLHLVLPLSPLAPEAAVAPAAAPVPSPERFPEPSPVAEPRLRERTPLWVPWTITGALAVGWATTAALAVQAGHDRDVIERPETPPERIASARRLHITLAAVSDVLLASALTSAGISAYLTWWSAPPEGASTAVSHLPRDVSLKVSGHF